MRVSRFAYDLPPELVAQEPAPERGGARLMLAPTAGPITHARIEAFAEAVPAGALVVVNDTKVMRARIVGAKEGTGGRAEVFLVRRLVDDAGGPGQRWAAMAKASKALRSGTRIRKGPLTMTIEGRTDDGLFVVRLEAEADDLDAVVHDAGQMPLPPYIKRDPRPEDEDRYQTIFARAVGAVAAPTAGLHLTPALVARLEARGCTIAKTTLHVGLGTFQPVVVDDLDDHPMHSERYEVSSAVADAIAAARTRGAPVVAVGTTVVRALESARDPAHDGFVRASTGDTRLLIQPGYRFGVVDRLLTNFHLPESTLLALVCAFAGTDRILAAYAEAVRERYRFFSYGDAMFIARDDAEPQRAQAPTLAREVVS